MRKKNIQLLFLLFLLISCQSKWESAQLIGEWKTTEWIKMDNNENIDGRMDFKFDADSRYVLDYGSQLEKGKYWIANAYLHTIEDGQVEKKVLIKKLTKDSLIFEMNRAGFLEKVTLIKS